MWDIHDIERFGMERRCYEALIKGNVGLRCTRLVSPVVRLWTLVYNIWHNCIMLLLDFVSCSARRLKTCVNHAVTGQVKHPAELDIPGGFQLVEQRLRTVITSFSRLTIYNQKVFGPIYGNLLQKLCQAWWTSTYLYFYSASNKHGTLSPRHASLQYFWIQHYNVWLYPVTLPYSILCFSFNIFQRHCCILPWCTTVVIHDHSM